MADILGVSRWLFHMNMISCCIHMTSVFLVQMLTNVHKMAPVSYIQCVRIPLARLCVFVKKDTV